MYAPETACNGTYLTTGEIFHFLFRSSHQAEYLVYFRHGDVRHGIRSTVRYVVLFRNVDTLSRRSHDCSTWDDCGQCNRDWDGVHRWSLPVTPTFVLLTLSFRASIAFDWPPEVWLMTLGMFVFGLGQSLLSGPSQRPGTLMVH